MRLPTSIKHSALLFQVEEVECTLEVGLSYVLVQAQREATFDVDQISLASK